MLAQNGNSFNLYVDSARRLSGSSSDFTIPIALTASDYDTVVVKQLSVPKSMYLFNAEDATFYLGLRVGGVNIEIPLTLELGNYSLTCFTHCATQLLNTNGKGVVFTMGFPGPTQPSTGRFTISYTASGGVLPVYLRFTGYGIGQGFGFASHSINNFVSGRLVSQNVVQLTGVQAVYLYSDLVDNAFEGQILQEVIACSTSDFSYLEYLWCGDIGLSSKNIAHKGSDTYRFWVCDSLGNAINLNGLNVFFSLIFYKRNNLSDLQRSTLMLEHFQKLN